MKRLNGRSNFTIILACCLVVLALALVRCGGGGGGGSNGTGTQPSATDNAQILSLLNGLSALYGAGIPSGAELSPYFDPMYLNDGKNRTLELLEWSSGSTTDTLTWPPIGQNISLLSTELLASSPKIYRVEFLHTLPPGQPSIGEATVIFEGTTCRLYGNQRIMFIVAVGSIARGILTSSQETYSGLLLLATDHYGNNAASPVHSVVVTGPGLPSGGIVLLEAFSVRAFNYFPGLLDDELIMYAMTDQQIGAVTDNAAYTFTLKKGSDGTGDTVAVYVKKIYKRPPLSSEISDALFPTYSTPVSHALSAANYGGTLDVAWTNPVTQTTRTLELEFKQGTSEPSLFGFGPFSVNMYSFNSAGMGLTPIRANLQLINVDISRGWAVFHYWEFK